MTPFVSPGGSVQRVQARGTIPTTREACWADASKSESAMVTLGRPDLAKLDQGVQRGAVLAPDLVGQRHEGPSSPASVSWSAGSESLEGLVLNDVGGGGACASDLNLIPPGLILFGLIPYGIFLESGAGPIRDASAGGLNRRRGDSKGRSEQGGRCGNSSKN